MRTFELRTVSLISLLMGTRQVYSRHNELGRTNIILSRKSTFSGHVFDLLRRKRLGNSSKALGEKYKRFKDADWRIDEQP